MKAKETFSIYKVDEDQLLKELNKTGKYLNANELADELCKWLLSKYSNNNDIVVKKYKQFCCIYVPKSNEAKWGSFICELMNLDVPIINNSNAYFLIRVVNDIVFIMPGGSGTKMIENIVEKNFGIDMIPKISKENDNIISSLSTDRTYGKELERTIKLKGLSNFSDESDFNSIPKNTLINCDSSVSKKLKLKSKEDEVIRSKCGDQLCVLKSMTIDDLDSFLINLESVSKESDNFNISTLIRAKKLKYKESELDKKLFELYQDNHKVISIRQDTSTDDFMIWTKVKIIYKGESHVLEFFDSNSLYILMIKINKKISKSFVSDFIKKSQVVLLENSRELTKPRNLSDFIYAVMEYDGKTFVKLNSIWYTYRENIYEYMDNEYKKKFDLNYSALQDTKVIKDYGIIKSELLDKDGKLTSKFGENAYNLSFVNNNDVIVSHPNYFNNVEFADLIFWDDDRIYLMCNKSELSNDSVRDLENQMETAIVCLKAQIDSKNNWIKEYYNKFDEKQKEKISLIDFKKKFDKKVVFIAGFKSNYKKKTNSIYAKHILNNLIDIAVYNDFECLIMNYSEETKKN